MASANQDAHKELFLDILTKEEKEALLTKKMEDIRKRNEALQKRHAEIEADKKIAEKTGSALPNQRDAQAPKSSSVMDDHDPRRSNRHTQQQQQQQASHLQQQQSPASKPATRSKPPAHGGDGWGRGRGPKERPKSQDFRSDASYEYEPIVDVADLDSRLAKRSHSPSKHRRNPPRERLPAALSNYDRPSNSGHNNTDHPPQDRRGSREPRGGRVYTQTFICSRSQGRIPSEDGPPPDPVNFLCDRARDPAGSSNRQQEKPIQDGGGDRGGGGGGGRGKDPRRHPRNFGGQDFNNVKSQMKAIKDKEKDRRSFPPKNRMEMSMVLTGSERFQYEEWKAERQKVDQERLERQRTASGEWRRAWDQEKNARDFDEPPSPSRTEPARRPAGRIGSGRFDRGERDDRRAENLSQSPKGTSGMQGVAVPETERKPPAGRGRGRGRGRARAQAGAPGGEKPPRPRTWSGGDDSRTVECTKDNGLLLVKIDKSRGSDDHSVEVEYGNDEAAPGERRKSSPSKKKSNRKSPVKQSKQSPPQHQPQQFHDAEIPVPTQASPPVYMSSQDSSMDGRPASLSQSLSHCSTDEWEDITGTDSDMYGTTEDEAESIRRAGGVRLNPDAPVFLPTSPDLLKMPGSFHSSDSGASGPASPSSTSAAQPKLSPPEKSSQSELVANGSLHGDDDTESAEAHKTEAEAGKDDPEPSERSHADYEDDDHEDDDDHFFDSEEVDEKPPREKEESFEEEELGETTHHDTKEEFADVETEDVSASVGASLADELSAAAAGSSARPPSPGDTADTETIAASVQEESVTEQSVTDSDHAESAQGEAREAEPAESEAHEAEPAVTDSADCAQDEVLETEPSETTDNKLVGETLPDPAAVDVPEEGASSCEQAAPEEDNPLQATQQMATTLTSSPTQAEESVEKVMDKPEASPEETAVPSPEGCNMTETSSSAPLSASD